MTTPHAPGTVPRPILRRIVRGAYHALAITGACFLLYCLCFDCSVIASGSMAPTLMGESTDGGEWVLTEKVSYHFRRPRRWEIVTFRKRDGLQVMKRVVGLPGESVCVHDGRAWIDGDYAVRPLSISNVKYYPYGNLRHGASYHVQRGIYVLGDDSRDSQDSRYEGPVQPGDIRGRAWAVVWPPNRIRLVNP